MPRSLSLTKCLHFRVDNRVVFCLISLIQFLVIFSGDLTVFTEAFYVNLLGQAHYSDFEIENIRRFNLELGWVFYVLNPFMLFIKLAIISAFIFLIAYLKDISTSFQRVFRIVTLLEIIFIVETLVTIIWMGSMTEEISMFYYRSFSPLSLINLISDSYLEQNLWLILPLKSVTMFQLIYMVALTYCFSIEFQRKVSVALGIVVSSYVVLFLFYIGCLMFIQMMDHKMLINSY